MVYILVYLCHSYIIVVLREESSLRRLYLEIEMQFKTQRTRKKEELKILNEYQDIIVRPTDIRRDAIVVLSKGSEDKSTADRPFKDLVSNVAQS
ncbi:hypothetical protein P5V15_006352 [Pogonomyrmex californicus]